MSGPKFAVMVIAGFAAVLAVQLLIFHGILIPRYLVWRP